MINLSDITGYYIEVTFIDQQKLLILDSFSLIEDFGLTYYEDKYIDLISQSDLYDTSAQSLMFLELLSIDLKDIITQHGIKLDKEQPTTLQDLTELCHLLLLLPNMDDYSDVAYKVHGSKDPRNTFIDLIERFSMMTRLRAMEIIEDVNETLIETLRELSVSALEVDDSVIDKEHRKYIDRFTAFIDNTPCLGLALLEQGYKPSLSLDELINIITIDIPKRTDSMILTNLPQLSLDVLSLLVVTRDDYSMPVFKYKKKTHLFSDNPETVSKLANCIFKIVNDFSLYLEAAKQEEAANGN